MRAGYQGRRAREAHAAARSGGWAGGTRVFRGMVERRVWAHAVRGEMPHRLQLYEWIQRQHPG